MTLETSCSAVPTFLARAGRAMAPVIGYTPVYVAAYAAGLLRLGKVACVHIGQVEFHFDMTDYYQGLMALQRYEPETAHILRQVLRPGDIYVDVGAQLGYTAVQAAQLVGGSGCLLLFEPDPRLAHGLKSLAELHAAQPSNMPLVHFVPAACSDSEVPITFGVLRQIGHSTAVWSSRHDPIISHVEVPAVIVDRELESRGIGSVRMVKIDVEGFEISVLRGMRRLIEARQADVLLVECCKWMLRRSGYGPEHLHAMLAHNGYTGCCSCGTPLTKDCIESNQVKNLLYVRDPSMLAAIFPKLCQPASPPYDVETLRSLCEEACDPRLPRVEANRIIEMVRNGNLEAGIDDGEALLREHPDQCWFRGHVAWWNCLAGHRDVARRHYEIMLEADPTDPGIREALRKLDS